MASREPLRSLPTHAVENQVPPLEDFDLFGTDTALVEGVERGGASWANERLRTFGERLASAHGIELGYAASRAGGAIPELVEAIDKAEAAAPLGNASPESLAKEVTHLLQPGLDVTGSVRHVDGGYNFVA